MQANTARSTSRFQSIIEWAFLVIFGLLLGYALVAWLEIHPSIRVHNPRGFLLLTIGMFLQPVAALLLRRSRPVAYTLLAISLLFLVAAIRLVAS